MESLNPQTNPELSLKRKYNNNVQVRLDDDLLEELTTTVINNKYVYNSVSHFIRCAIIEKLRGKK